MFKIQDAMEECKNDFFSRHEFTEPTPTATCSMLNSPFPEWSWLQHCSLHVTGSDHNWHCPLLRPDSPDSVSCVSGECLMGAAWLGREQRSSDDIQTRSWTRPLIGHWVTTLLSHWSEHLAYLVRDQPETGLVGPEWLCEWFERRVGGMDWYVWIEKLVLCFRIVKILVEI